MPVLSLACHLPHNTPNIPSRYNNEQTTKQTKAINNSYIYISHVNVTQTVPDISPLMPMHQDPLLVSRIDAIWDCYPCDSLKTLAHKRRGCGPRTKVGDGSTHIPKRDWNSGFLKNEENEKELFPFISEMIANDDMDGRLLLTTKQESVLFNKPCDMSSVQPCNHSEADTRIFLHLAHAVHQGHKVAYVRTVDSDVVVLAVFFFQNTWPGAVLGRLWFWKIIQRHSHPQHLCSTQAIEVTGFAPISRSHRLWYNITFPGMKRRLPGKPGRVTPTSQKPSSTSHKTQLCWH